VQELSAPDAGIQPIHDIFQSRSADLPGGHLQEDLLYFLRDGFEGAVHFMIADGRIAALTELQRQGGIGGWMPVLCGARANLLTIYFTVIRWELETS